MLSRIARAINLMDHRNHINRTHRGDFPSVAHLYDPYKSRCSNPPDDHVNQEGLCIEVATDILKIAKPSVSTHLEVNMRFIVAALLTGLMVVGASHAQAQTSTSRVWKLCMMEDPKCIEELRTAYYLASEAMKRNPDLTQYVCVKSEVPDDFLLRRFIQIVGTDPARFAALPIIETEKYLLTFGSRCSNGTIVPPNAAINAK
jgi:hypothetical protein